MLVTQAGRDEGRTGTPSRVRGYLLVDRRPFLEDRGFPFAAFLTMRLEMVSTFLSASFSWRRFCCRRSTASRSPSACLTHETGVRGDLVVLGTCRGPGQEHVLDLLRRLVLLHELVVLLLDAFDARARMSLGSLAKVLEHALEVGHVLLRLLEMTPECAFELAIARLASQLRQRLRQGLLRVVDVLQLVNEELFGRCH